MKKCLILLVMLVSMPAWAQDKPVTPVPAPVPKKDTVEPVKPPVNAEPVKPAPPPTVVVHKPRITFPKGKVIPQTVDSVNITLLDSVWYVVESDTKYAVIASPTKALTVMTTKGPTTLGGIFVDGTGADEIKTYQGPFITLIRKMRDATGLVDASFVPYGFTDETLIVHKTFDLGSPPGPTPVVTPPLPDKPVVIPPIPVPMPLTTAQKITASLVGPTAKVDAGILVAASEQVLAAMPTYVDGSYLEQHWAQLLTAGKWVKGSHPDITAIIEAALPETQTAPLPFTAADRARLTILFTAIQTGANEVLK